MATDARRIIQITACMTRGQKRDFEVWRWNPTADKWEPYHVEPSSRRDDRGAF